MSDLATLFSPFKLKSLTLPNRVVMAPITAGKRKGTDASAGCGKQSEESTAVGQG